MTEEELKKLAKEYQDGLDEVEEVRKEFNERFDQTEKMDFNYQTDGGRRGWYASQIQVWKLPFVEMRLYSGNEESQVRVHV